jgi:hypothetical protein
VRIRGTFGRRRMLAILAASCAWFGVPGLRVLSGSGAADAAPLSPTLAGLFTDRCSAEAVGAAYLRSVDDAEARPEWLVRSILGDGPATMDQAELKRVIGTRIRRDFTENAVVMVDGWMLSRTEARLCALIALAERPAEA